MLEKQINDFEDDQLASENGVHELLDMASFMFRR